MLWQAYVSFMRSYPFLAQCTTASCLCIAGDLIAQHGIEGNRFARHNFRRSLTFGMLGFAVAGPLTATWYRLLDSLVITPCPYKSVLYKVLLDQLCFSPFSLSLFFILNNLFMGHSLAFIRAKIHKDYWQTLLHSYKLWPAVQLLNFFFTPLNYRIAVTNIVAIGWNGYLSFMNFSQKSPLPADPLLEVELDEKLV